jgi:hypothetical protein
MVETQIPGSQGILTPQRQTDKSASPYDSSLFGK